MHSAKRVSIRGQHYLPKKSVHIIFAQVAILAMEAEEENLSDEKRLSLGQEVIVEHLLLWKPHTHCRSMAGVQPPVGGGNAQH